jgi:SAM-dependent methyltransferase
VGQPAPDRHHWDAHWHALDGERRAFGRLASLVRRRVLQGALTWYAERYFPTDGPLVEVGCGTGEASASLRRGYRIGADFSLGVLASMHGQVTYDSLLAADAKALPFGDASIAGIWNFGVMEHFPEDTGLAILRELRRVLAPGGVAILFWPPENGSSRWVLGPVERLRSAWSGRPFAFFPDEVNRLRNRRHGRELLLAAGLEPLRVDATWRDLFIHLVLVARRPTA